jgi:PAS domain S-box-containing protein
MLHFSNVAHRFRTLLRHPAEHSALATDTPMRAAEALAQSEERLRLAMEATALGTFEWDIATDAVKCSPSVKRQFGFSSDEPLTLESVVSRIHPDHREAVRATIREAMQAEGSHTYAGEFRTLLPDGSSAWIEARGAVLFSHLNTRPQCLIGIVLDITERKRMELNLHRSAADLSTANRMKDEFLATLAHKLRNPLTPIRNGLEILALTGFADPTQRRACDLMGRQLRHLMHLVDELLDASLINQGTLSLNKELVTLQGLVRNAVDLVRPQIEASRHELKLDLPTRIIAVEADPPRLSQAIANVLENGARYTPPGGRIIVRLRAERNGAALEILDNGPGLQPELFPRLFDMFGTARLGSSHAQGLGIGLALTRAIVEMHGGSIQGTSAGAGLGTVFRIWLPTLSLEALTTEPSNGHHAAPLPRRKVLIVDDDADSAESSIALLQLMGQDVLHAGDDRSAVEAAANFEPDVIFAAISTPALDESQARRGVRSVPMPSSAVTLKRILHDPALARRRS